jgi:hypothetical protein
MPTRNAIVLRVDRTLAGTEFPWDRVYFFRRDEEELLGLYFPCFLVTPLTKRLMKRVKKVVGITGDARRTLATTSHAYRRKGQKKLENRVARRSPLDAVIDDPASYVALVPILHLQHHRGQGKVGPMYLTAQPRIKSIRQSEEDKKEAQKKQRLTKAGKPYKKPNNYKSPEERAREADTRLKQLMRDAICAKTYFIVDGERIEPVCVACPKNLEALNGRCQFGHEQCYDNLTRSQVSDFRRGLREYRKIVQRIDKEAQ